MKVITWEELTTKTNEAPFYGVVKSRDDRTRAIGCGPLAFLNLILMLKKRLGMVDGKTAYDVIFHILDYIEEKQNLSINFQDAMEFIDKNPFFNSFRMLFLNPNGMVPEVFYQIALRRLERGEVALLIAEAPSRGEKAKGIANHLAIVHSEDGDVFFDGLKIDLETLINIVYFSPVNSLLFFSKNVEVK
ncbi:MAG: hypothetical protein ACK5V3_08910 [Bdellovibrionales bacterium]